MERKCPICNAILSHNCYVKDSGTATLSYLELITKDDNFKKIKYELKSCYCPNCGHVEFYVDLQEQPKENVAIDNEDLDAVVQGFAKEQQNRERTLQKKKKS